jgi:hypothetical protein
MKTMNKINRSALVLCMFLILSVSVRSNRTASIKEENITYVADGVTLNVCSV